MDGNLREGRLEADGASGRWGGTSMKLCVAGLAVAMCLSGAVAIAENAESASGADVPGASEAKDGVVAPATSTTGDIARKSSSAWDASSSASDAAASQAGEHRTAQGWAYYDASLGRDLTSDEMRDRVLQAAQDSVGEGEEQAWAYMKDACDEHGATWCEYGPCASVVWHFFDKAGLGHALCDGMVPAWSYELSDWYLQQGLMSDEPQVGSLIFFNNPGDYGEQLGLSSCHVEIVTSITDTQVTSIGAAAGGILEHTYTLGDPSIVGFGLPSYLE
ncbi:MAG: CHAP domain-containing protein [Coriobacteriales bacterium]